MATPDPDKISNGARSEATSRLTKDQGPRTKDQSIETLRGFALLCVLFHHAESASWVGDYVSWSIQLVMMPLFAAISGYLLGLKRIPSDGLVAFVVAKTHRILFPCFACISLMLILLWSFPGAFSILYTSGFPRSMGDVIRFYLVHPSTFWFLQAIFGTYLLIALLDCRGWFDDRRVWMTLIALSCVWLATPFATTGWFSLDGFQFLLPYVLLGFGFSRYQLRNLNANLRRWILIAGAATIIAMQIRYFGQFDWDFSQGSVLGISGSIVLVSACLLSRVEVGWLAALGGPSFSIYLFHRIGWVLGMLAIPFASLPLGTGLTLHVLLMLAVGWSVGRLLHKLPLTRTIFP